MGNTTYDWSPVMQALSGLIQQQKFSNQADELIGKPEIRDNAIQVTPQVTAQNGLNSPQRQAMYRNNEQPQQYSGAVGQALGTSTGTSAGTGTANATGQAIGTTVGSATATSTSRIRALHTARRAAGSNPSDSSSTRRRT